MDEPLDLAVLRKKIVLSLIECEYALSLRSIQPQS